VWQPAQSSSDAVWLFAHHLSALFINAVALYFMPKDLASRIAPFAYTACFAGAICMLVQLYPFAWAGACETGRPLCGKLLCTVRGEWHLAWLVPTNGMEIA